MLTLVYCYCYICLTLSTLTEDCATACDKTDTDGMQFKIYYYRSSQGGIQLHGAE